MSNLIKVYSTDLKVGMYVSKLDRPWLDSPFLLQGFYVKNSEDIEVICNHCDFVFVDNNKSSLRATEKKSAETGNSYDLQALMPDRNLQAYTDTVSYKTEAPDAREAVSNLSDCLQDILFGKEKGGPLEIARIKQAVEPMVESVSRNPDACIWLARMKQQDNYIYEHSLGSSIWAVALGRQLGLPRKDLKSLAIGGLLFDVGILRLDVDLLKVNRRLTFKERNIMKKHVEIGVSLLEEGGMMSQDILDMAAHHHERHNGEGYPNGLMGDEIPVFARIAAIVDCYDAITSNRSYSKAMPPSLAIKQLYEWKDIYFQGELIEEFIQAIGIYPAGTLVELTSGEIAIVVAESRSRRLRPQLMVLLGGDKKPLDEIKFIDLMKITHADDGKQLDIINSLKPNAYGIDISAIEL